MPLPPLQIQPADQIRWEEMRYLAKQLDELAIDLKVTTHIPNYLPLVQDQDLPFSEPSVYQTLPANLRIHWDLTAGSSVATAQYLTEGQAVPWVWPTPTLENLADLEELYITTLSDGCWCDAIHTCWRDPNGRAYIGMPPVGEPYRCCWRVFVPQSGEDLALGGSDCIRSGIVVKLANGILSRNRGEHVWLVYESCDGSQTKQHFRITRQGRNDQGQYLYQLTMVEREIIPNFLTWGMLKKYQYALVERLDDILTHSAGARMWRVRDPNPNANAVPDDVPGVQVCQEPDEPDRQTPPAGPAPSAVAGWISDGTFGAYPEVTYYYLYPGCKPERRHWQHDLWCALLYPDDLPEPPGSVTDFNTYPWEGQVYMSDECVDTGEQKVYALTVNHMSRIIHDARRYTWPRVSPSGQDRPVAGTCCTDGHANLIIDGFDPKTLSDFGKTILACRNPLSIDPFVESIWWDCPSGQVTRPGCEYAYANGSSPSGEELVMLVMAAARIAPFNTGCVELAEDTWKYCGAQRAGGVLEFNFNSALFGIDQVACSINFTGQQKNVIESTNNFIDCDPIPAEPPGFDYRYAAGIVTNAGPHTHLVVKFRDRTNIDMVWPSGEECSGDFAYNLTAGYLSYQVQFIIATRKLAEELKIEWENYNTP